MALRAYIDGLLVRNRIRSSPGVVVTRELEGYTSRAEFKLVDESTVQRPKMGQRVLIRDDRQLLRNSNRLNEDNWSTVSLNTLAATWGALPSQVGGSGLRWAVGDSGTPGDGYLTATMFLHEFPPQAPPDQAALATEERIFSASLFVQRIAPSAQSGRLTLTATNGASSYGTTAAVDLDDGTYTILSGAGEVYIDASDANWWRITVVVTMAAASGTATTVPYVQITWRPYGDTVVCCAQLSELAALPSTYGTTWDDLLIPWSEAGYTWGDLAGPEDLIPDYVDRRNVSCNEFLGIVAGTKVQLIRATQTTPPRSGYVELAITAVDYTLLMSRTLVTETFSSATDEGIINTLFSEHGSPAVHYAPYLTASVNGDAVSSLNFTWVDKPLTECLAELTAQTGKTGRVDTEGRYIYGVPRVESIPWTFGDAYNLVENSCDPSIQVGASNYDSFWNIAGVSVTRQESALPYGGVGDVFVLEDFATGAATTARAVVASAATNTQGVTLGEPRDVYVRLFAKKTASSRVITISAACQPAPSVRKRCHVDLVDGIGVTETGYTGTGPYTAFAATAVEDDDGGQWWDIQFSLEMSIGRESIYLTLYPSLRATPTGTDSKTLTGSFTFGGLSLTYEAPVHFLCTGTFTAYINDPTNWNLEVSGRDMKDLANVITVKSDEAGTYSHTATDSLSVAEYTSLQMVIVDSTLGSDAACQLRAETELALKAWPRESLTIKCWGKVNVDVGMLAVAAQQDLLQHQAVGQLVQSYRLEYTHANAASVTLGCAPFNDRRVTKAIRKALAF